VKGDSGPPWIKYARGYFLEGSKFEGLKTQPSYYFLVLELVPWMVSPAFLNLKISGLLNSN
jgi:hypothetical protein